MATTILASCGFKQSNLHSSLSCPSIALAGAAVQKRYSETDINSGSTYTLKLCYFTLLFIITMVRLVHFNLVFYILYSELRSAKSCQCTRWRKKIKGSSYRTTSDLTRQGSHAHTRGTSGFVTHSLPRAEQEFAISSILFHDHTDATDFSSCRELF